MNRNLLAALFLCACSNTNAMNDGGVDGSTTSDASSDGSSDAGTCSGSSLSPFTAPKDPGAGGILFTASGEVLALSGYPFPPAQPGDPAFVDGWDVHFKRLLVTIDHITISDMPDKAPGDQSQTGAALATLNGPWAVDLTHDDPSYLDGKGGPGERAVPIAALPPGMLKTDGTRYAFGFDVTKANACAQNVNLDAAAQADYEQMVSQGCAVLYVGTATFKGDNNAYPGCVPPGYDKWPATVDFKLCFKSPTTYVNCQNPDNMGTAFPNEEYQRGIALDATKSVVAQITIHTDHPFWDSVLHNSPAHFDQFAARVVGSDAGTPLVTLDMTQGVDYTGYTDALGNKLQWRYCMDPPVDVHPKFTGPMAFDPQSIPHATGNDPASGLRDYYDFSTYNQSTQGHLNADGLCFVKRAYPSPP